jgi:hypothetical protein
MIFIFLEVINLNFFLLLKYLLKNYCIGRDKLGNNHFDYE